MMAVTEHGEVSLQPFLLGESKMNGSEHPEAAGILITDSITDAFNHCRVYHPLKIESFAKADGVNDFVAYGLLEYHEGKIRNARLKRSAIYCEASASELGRQVGRDAYFSSDLRHVADYKERAVFSFSKGNIPDLFLIKGRVAVLSEFSDDEKMQFAKGLLYGLKKF
jgi:hypothetical protein